MCKPFIDYLNAVDELLEAQYGITTADVGMDSAALRRKRDGRLKSMRNG